MHLADHLKETADRIAGYITGRLIVESDTASLQIESGAKICLTDKHAVEVRNGSEYVSVTLEQALEAQTVEGWPLYGGLYARVK